MSNCTTHFACDCMQDKVAEQTACIKGLETKLKFMQADHEDALNALEAELGSGAIERFRELRIARDEQAAEIERLGKLVVQLQREIDIVTNPSDGRCMEIGALRVHRNKLEAEIERLEEMNSNLASQLAGIVSLDFYKAEIERLKKLIAKELNENDELGAEYTYVNILKAENAKLRAALEKIAAWGLPPDMLETYDNKWSLEVARQALGKGE